jgi:NhaP-type Na+/H+ or K+/H+ antiporter
VAAADLPQARVVNEFWYLLVGVLLIAIALLGKRLDRLPVSPAMIYLFVGFALGPAGFDALELHPMRELLLLETITEIALLIALFTVGIKLRVPIGDWRWTVPLRLATVSECSGCTKRDSWGGAGSPWISYGARGPVSASAS